MQAANALKGDLENSEEKEEACIGEINQHSEQITAIDESLGEYQLMVHGVQELEEELKELQWRADEQARRVAERRESLEQEFSETSEAELEEQLAGFEEGMAAKVQSLEELKDELRSVHRSVGESRHSLSVISARRGEAFSLRQQSGAQALSLIGLMKEVSSSSSSSSSSYSSASSEHLALNLQTPDFAQLEADSIGENGTEVVLAESNKFVEALESTLTARRTESDGKVAAAQSAVDTAYERHMEASRSFQQLSAELGTLEEELRRIEQDRAQTRRDMQTAAKGGGAGSLGQQKAQAEVSGEGMEFFGPSV